MPRAADRASEREAIIRAAAEVGQDPAAALAIAERESNFNPQARSSKTIRGMFQMRGDLRQQHGVGDSDDPYVQAQGWIRFFQGVKRDMAKGLGRDPTDSEGYLGHHFGAKRAARMMTMHPDTPVDQVFTPREMAENPHFGKAGTVGRLNSTILADMDKRQAKFGAAVPDFAAAGEQLGNTQAAASAEAPDFSSFGQLAEPSTEPENLNMGSAPAASSAPDFSGFGTPA